MTFLAQLLQAADRAADLFGLARRPIEAEELISEARRRTGLHDFAAVSISEPLRVLTLAYESEADLTLFGRVGARWDLLRYLCNLLILSERESAKPAIAAQRIVQPIFITGLPRSGTTFLHNLLAQDRANLVPRCWQTIYPYPGHPAAGRGARPERVQRQLRAFARIAPKLRSLHPFDAWSPQECTDITAHTFASLRFDITHEVPSYRRWLARTGHREAYRFHRRFLQHLQHQACSRSEPDGERSERWVLKSPDHVFALEAISEIYPDANIVFVHRDPLKVLPSSCRLTEVLRRPFTRRLDPLRIGEQVACDWANAALKLIAASDRDAESGRNRIFHIHYKMLIAAPFETVIALYRHFGLPVSASATAAVKRFIAERPRGGYGRNLYRFDTYGLEPAREARRFSDYMERFEIEPELAPVQVVAPIAAKLDVRGQVQLSHGT